MDFHCTASCAPVRDVDRPPAGAYCPPTALDALEAEITELWGHINAATARFLALLAEFDRREGWAQHGLTSCAHWLNWQCGISRVAAREKVRTARALASLPKIAAAFGEGRLSYSKVRELLLKALEAAEAQLEERVGDAESADAEANAVAAESAVSEGVSAETPPAPFTLPPRPGAVPPGVSAETPPRSISQRRADALEHILERFLTGKGSGSAAGAHELVVHIAHDALCDVPKSSGASFKHGGPVAVETARRLGCDGALVGVVKGERGEPLAVGRRTRAVPPAIRRALRVRDGGCRFPGCDRSRFTHAHHIKHWADGGETNLDNLVTLCSQHHRLVHEGGYGVRVREGEIQFTRPDGQVIPPAGRPHQGCFRGNTSAAARGQPTGGAQRLAVANAARGVSIDAGTARCRWNGERMDYDIAIDALCREAGYP